MPPNTKTQTDQYSQLIERLGSAENILITVSDSPTVDQLAACIGLTLAFNKLGKNATAVFSGKVPSTLEFLQPERTLETNTNSLRDFIISLDKSKADKLRYKVEDEYVKIFITPYRTSINKDDLNFEQGDFNIDLIITLGVQDRTHLDGAIVAHGRILHDATVASISLSAPSELGTINWADPDASSLCEMASDLISEIDKSIVDSQIATALLTGMVAETDRFGNEKARPHTMSVAGVLMSAGASPQLVASKLQEPEPEPEPEAEEPDGEIPEVVEDQEDDSSEDAPAEEPKKNDGTIQIDHSEDPVPEESQTEDLKPEEELPTDDIHIDEEGKLKAIKDLEAARLELEEQAKKDAGETTDDAPEQKSMALDPPQFSGQLTANTIAEHEQTSPSTDPMSMSSSAPLLERTEPQNLPSDPKDSTEDKVTPPEMPQDQQTLTDIEKSVQSLHLEENSTENKDNEPVPDNGPEVSVPPPPPVDDARAAVEEAVESVDTYRPEPINALGATPVNLNLGHTPAASSSSDDNDDQDNGQADEDSDKPSEEEPKTEASVDAKDSKTPPPVPPPFMPGT
jgi:hypothetical protein